MSFLTPTFLALAALAVPILILYMLRLRRREVLISSTLLWQMLVQDREANSPWQKLRRNLLLLLQLLVLAALVIALSRPFVRVPGIAAGNIALLLDASASMGAADLPGGQTRFEAAQSEARALVNSLAEDEVMSVIVVGPSPQVLSPPTSDRAALREAINRARPVEASADWEAALTLAAASVAGRPDAALVIISDGGLPADLPPLPARVRYIRVGREGDNVAISALATRPLGDAPQLFAAVTNYGSQDAEVILSLEVDGQLHSAERLSVPAGQTASLTITDLPPSTQLIRASLTPPAGNNMPDYLSADDTAYAVYTPPIGGRVLLITPGNLFLEQVLSALPGVEAFRAPPGGMPQGQFDLVILDGWLPDTLPPSSLLIVNPPASTNLFSVGESFTATRFLRQVDDPILAFVDFSGVAVREARLVQTPGWAQTLVEAEGGPLLLAGMVEGRRVAILTFDLHASDLPLQIAFPILFANLMEWYAPARPFDTPDGLQPGQPLLIRPQATTTACRITAPDGSTQTIPIREGGITYTATSQLGVYRVELLAGSEVQTEGWFAVNLFAPEESRIAPAESITVGQTEVTQAREGEEYGQRELWHWLAVVALGVLLIEWWVYHRGSVLTVSGKSLHAVSKVHR
jgi:hypothetical protein